MGGLMAELDGWADGWMDQMGGLMDEPDGWVNGWVDLMDGPGGWIGG